MRKLTTAMISAILVLFAATAFAEINEIKYPLFSAPVFVQPGNSFTLVLDTPDAEPLMDAKLVALDGSSIGLPVPMSMTENGETEIAVALPSDTPDGLFGLCVVLGFRDVCSPHSVAVKESFDPPFTFGQITDFHVGDPRALKQFPGVDIDRVRLRALKIMNERKPDFVLITGDVCAYPETYEEDYPAAVKKILENTEIPTVIIPGNHDLYAKTDMDGNLETEGLDYWHKYFGPTHQYFDYGKIRFIGLNTYTWSQAVRNRNRPYHSKVGTSHTYQGALTQDEYSWIVDALKTKDGRMPVFFSHHSPRTFEFMPQQWCEDCVPPTKFLSLIKKAKAPYYIYGHIHRNEDKEENGTHFVATTSVGSDVDENDLWAVRFFHVNKDMTFETELIKLFEEPPMPGE